VIRGSIDLGRDYFTASSLYLKKLNELDSSILKRLEAIGRAGSVKVKEEIIVSSIVGFLIILLLTGIYFFLQRKAPII
jgi:hypothetical protein